MHTNFSSIMARLRSKLGAAGAAFSALADSDEHSHVSRHAGETHARLAAEMRARQSEQYRVLRECLREASTLLTDINIGPVLALHEELEVRGVLDRPAPMRTERAEKAAS